MGAGSERARESTRLDERKDLSETEVEPTETPTEPAEAPVEPVEPAEENPDAEPSEPIEGPGDDDEASEEAQESEPSALAMTQEQDKALTSEQKRHTTAVSKILGDAATEAILCPFCDPSLQGFLFPGDLDHPRDEVHAAMVACLRPAAAPDFKAAPHAHRCDDCDGFGMVASGSRKPGNETIGCPSCKGAGYIVDPRYLQNGAAELVGKPEGVLVGASEPVIEDSDPWGSPRLMVDGQENPNYGKMPQYKNPQLP